MEILREVDFSIQGKGFRALVKSRQKDHKWMIIQARIARAIQESNSPEELLKQKQKVLASILHRKRRE